MTTPLPYPMPAAPRKRTLLLLLYMLTLSACALRTASPSSDTAVLSPARGAQLQGTVVKLSTQRTLSFEAFVKVVGQAQVVAVGEEHDHADIQAFELRLLQALVQHRPRRVALAMEFLERDMQSAIDAYLAGNSDAATFQMQIKAPPDFIQYYFPLVQYARQAGVPVLALNVPRYLARRVTREGLQAVVKSLRPPERAYLAAAFSPITPQYRTYFLRQLPLPIPSQRSNATVLSRQHI
jgi:uncharacterized iron-regulated protein